MRTLELGGRKRRRQEESEVEGGFGAGGRRVLLVLLTLLHQLSRPVRTLEVSSSPVGYSGHLVGAMSCPSVDGTAEARSLSFERSSTSFSLPFLEADLFVFSRRLCRDVQERTLQVHLQHQRQLPS